MASTTTTTCVACKATIADDLYRCPVCNELQPTLTPPAPVVPMPARRHWLGDVLTAVMVLDWLFLGFMWLMGFMSPAEVSAGYLAQVALLAVVWWATKG